MKLSISLFLIVFSVSADGNKASLGLELQTLLSYDKKLVNLKTAKEKQEWLRQVQVDISKKISETKKAQNLTSQIHFESVQTFFKYFPDKITEEKCFKSLQNLKSDINPAENLDPVKDYSIAEKKVFLMYHKYCSKT